jgi:hypothetical protein
MTQEELIDKINKDLYLEEPVTLESYQTISKFTMLWSIYEGRLFNENYCNSLMRNKVDTGLIRLHHWSIHWDYFRRRYLSNNRQVNETFAGLAFKSPRDRARLEEIITDDTSDERAITEAILMIVHRLRNNLFHGIKKVASYNLQRENLEMACSVLTDVLTNINLQHGR